ncbi:hypothetical protein HMPREF3206_01009 [Fusobacterium equinum]|uniref:Uncharacterized protein n=1 Tax=Fusobacterium equinum TaxID=134605 RepID=A0A133NDF0_9FUSO|nr:hypothetical protein HMPREF3206_01009 [Fusobacterium equinum]
MSKIMYHPLSFLFANLQSVSNFRSVICFVFLFFFFLFFCIFVLKKS